MSNPVRVISSLLVYTRAVWELCFLVDGYKPVCTDSWKLHKADQSDWSFLIWESAPLINLCWTSVMSSFAPNLRIQIATAATHLINLEDVVIYCLFLFILEDASSLISDLSLSPPAIHLFYPLFPVLIPRSVSGDRQGLHLGTDRDR